MRLLYSVLTKVPKANTSQRKFLGHFIGLLLMLPGHATFRNLSRYSSYHEKTFARQFAKPFDFFALNKAAILAVVPAEHEQALVLDASFVAKSGKHTSLHLSPFVARQYWRRRRATLHRFRAHGVEDGAFESGIRRSLWIS